MVLLNEGKRRDEANGDGDLEEEREVMLKVVGAVWRRRRRRRSKGREENLYTGKKETKKKNEANGPESFFYNQKV